MEEIKRLISENKLEEAIRLLDAYLTEQPRSDEAWFLLGKAHYKTRQRTPSPQQLPASDRDQSGKPGTSGLRYGDQGAGFL